MNIPIIFENYDLHQPLVCQLDLTVDIRQPLGKNGTPLIVPLAFPTMDGMFKTSPPSVLKCLGIGVLCIHHVPITKPFAVFLLVGGQRHNGQFGCVSPVATSVRSNAPGAAQRSRENVANDVHLGGWRVESA